VTAGTMVPAYVVYCQLLESQCHKPSTVTNMNIPAYNHRPDKSEYFDYYDTYVQNVPEGDLLENASTQVLELQEFFASMPEVQSNVLHAPFTWTIKQVVGHMIDTERIFANRLHRFACGDFQPESGMDQDVYVRNCNYEAPSLASLVDEWRFLRLANVLLMQRLTPSAWGNIGVASEHKVSVRALGYMLVGHVAYHMKIVRSRIANP
jgi:hypothetical protein